MTAASPKASPCDGCDARCCWSYTVYVTGADVFRIAGAMGLEPAEFLAYVAQGERSATGFLLEPGGPTFELALKTVSNGDPRRPCLFLRVDEATGAGRCGIYPARPAACRRFPAIPREGGGVAVRPIIVCPEGAWDGYPIDRLSWRVALLREQREVDLYAVVVGEWNARVEAANGHGPHTVERFLEHVCDAYAWITRMRHALGPGEDGGGTLLERMREALRELPEPA
jgi:Fe-S-cluster containining protein